VVAAGNLHARNVNHARVAKPSDTSGVAQALAGVAPTVIESRSKDWVPLLLGFCAGKGGGGDVTAGRRDADSEDEDGGDAEDAALAGAAAGPSLIPCLSNRLMRPQHLWSTCLLRITVFRIYLRPHLFALAAGP